jgi:hypothetical protein
MLLTRIVIPNPTPSWMHSKPPIIAQIPMLLSKCMMELNQEILLTRRAWMPNGYIMLSNSDKCRSVLHQPSHFTAAIEGTVESWHCKTYYVVQET